MYFITTLIALIFSSVVFAGDFIGYKSYDDFKIKKGEEYTLVSYKHANGQIILKLKDDNGQEMKTKCGIFWGFIYKNTFFRVDQKANQCAQYAFADPEDLSDDELAYYMNGWQGLSAKKNNKYIEYTPGKGGYCYVSKGINGKLFSIGYERWKGSRFKKYIKAIKEEHPELKEFYEYINQSEEASNSIMPAVQAYNKVH